MDALTSDHSLGLHLQSLRFAHREIARTCHRLDRAQLHRQMMAELQFDPAIALANHHCRVAAGNLRSAFNKRNREIREL